ncbi:19683_t:CDS:2, partial [Racocetra persica]
MKSNKENTNDSGSSTILNRGQKRKAVTTKEAAKSKIPKYLYHGFIVTYIKERNNYSYNEFLLHNRDNIIASISPTNKWRYCTLGPT